MEHSAHASLSLSPPAAGLGVAALEDAERPDLRAEAGVEPGAAPPSAAALGLLALFGMPSVVRGSAGVAGMPCAAAPVRLSPLARESVAAAHTGQGLTPASAPPNSVWEAAECYFAEWSK